MTRPPNPKSAKVRKIKVWVAVDSKGRVLSPEFPACRRREDAVYDALGIEDGRAVPATLLLPAKAKGKA
jgi:hypothetical protein